MDAFHMLKITVMARLILTLITLDPSTPPNEFEHVLSGIVTGLQINNPDLEILWICATNPEDVFKESILELIK